MRFLGHSVFEKKVKCSGIAKQPLTMPERSSGRAVQEFGGELPLLTGRAHVRLSVLPSRSYRKLGPYLWLPGCRT